MQAVILVGGEGRRMRPLTYERPKALVSVAGRPLVEHLIDALPPDVDEIILVVGYKAEMIRNHFGERYRGRRVKYVFQWMPAGTAHALSMAAPLLGSDRFFVLYGDDLHDPASLRRALDYPFAILAARHPEPWKFGVIETNPDGTMARIVEKPDHPTSNLISTGPMIIDSRIFNYEAVKHEKGEYFLTHPLGLFANDHPMMVVEQALWVPVGCPDDIPKAEAALASL